MSQVSILLSAESVPYQEVKATFDAHQQQGSYLIAEAVPNMISCRLTYSTGTEPIFISIAGFKPWIWNFHHRLSFDTGVCKYIYIIYSILLLILLYYYSSYYYLLFIYMYICHCGACH